MRVYHFANAQYGFENIRERRLKIARIMELNDPFEFLGVDLSNRTFRKAMKDTKKDIAKARGIICFSKNWNNPVLWSHYADKHKGLCLGFDIPNHLLSKVNYVEKRLSINGKVEESVMLKVLTTKFSHWNYEEEYRQFVSLDEEINGLYYANFSDNLHLKRVVIGAHSGVSRAQVGAALGGMSNAVEVFRARAAFSTFKIVRNRAQEH